ncbi:hypothetical protein PQJ75_27150 [Rhodoplanes sp. TEM]|uniref:Peptidase M15A C-terminal domain-containing protein n=1 Tax=Rhodoplanes tepidamans TaxID=200616 RepID=A0ABT5JDQ0_RHOTP|nr:MULTISPECIES: hypothetical protein [Rhodoplanes]MDC7787809.1 hypothetical protein [Rhodoplanes tepidamans]MDC7987427.1 hypothetical protein [Rhodoplanes sp. TEM]MDQ0357725.1 hypothetical protein [Rhodoplanes tepidamans]
MTKFWSTALVAAVVVALPAAAMARPHKARSHSVHAHSSHAHDARHPAAGRHAAKATRHRAHRHVRARTHQAATRAERRAFARARAMQAYAYAPAVAPNGSTGPEIQTAPGFEGMPAPAVHRADGARTPRLGGIVAPLAQKAAEISAACGARVISGVRHTRVAGTGRMSLHASGRAIDMRGNPGCIYRMLQGWAGGYTTDYGRAGHVHISWGGSEHGLRFAHGGGRSRHAHKASGRARWAGRSGGRRG